jgi:hypothetical protein
MEKSLAELFVLAACAEFAPLHTADDLNGLKAAGLLHNGAEGLHSPVQNAPAFIEAENALVEKGLNEGRCDNAPSQSASHCQVSSIGHDDPP